MKSSSWKKINLNMAFGTKGCRNDEHLGLKKYNYIHFRHIIHFTQTDTDFNH